MADPPLYSSLTTDIVVQRLTAQPGNAASHVEIAEAIAWLLLNGIIHGGPGAIGLQTGWRERLGAVLMSDEGVRSGQSEWCAWSNFEHALGRRLTLRIVSI